MAARRTGSLQGPTSIMRPATLKCTNLPVPVPLVLSSVQMTRAFRRVEIEIELGSIEVLEDLDTLGQLHGLSR